MTKIIETTEEMRPCRTGPQRKGIVPTEDHMMLKEVYEDKSIRWTCKDCGRRYYTIFVKASNRKKKDAPDWLKTWQKK